MQSRKFQTDPAYDKLIDFGFFKLRTTVSIRIVADCGAHIFQITMKFKQATTLDLLRNWLLFLYNVVKS